MSRTYTHRDWRSGPPTPSDVIDREAELPEDASAVFIYVRDPGMNGEELIVEVRVSEGQPAQVEFCEPFGGEFALVDGDEGFEWGPWAPSSAETLATRDLVDAANTFRVHYVLATMEDPPDEILAGVFALFNSVVMRHPMTKSWVEGQKRRLGKNEEHV